jgi:ABC-type oligopeptide transport system substrate-binding subunit
MMTPANGVETFGYNTNSPRLNNPKTFTALNMSAGRESLKSLLKRRRFI